MVLTHLGLILVGLLLGISGGGGSIFLVPLLVYGWGMSAPIAIQESLLVIGLNALFGGLGYLKKGLICTKSIFYFGLPALVVVVLTRYFLVPNLPLIFLEGSFWAIEKDQFLMLLFSFLMLLSGFWMVLKKNTTSNDFSPQSFWVNIKIIFAACLIGFLSGLLGAGGGFLLVPALMHWRQLEIKKAVGSSLWIITGNALIGFFVQFNGCDEYTSSSLQILFFTFLGMILGISQVKKINPQYVKILFVTAVFWTAVYILFKIFSAM